jgi:hypothetical protein
VSYEQTPITLETLEPGLLETWFFPNAFGEEPKNKIVEHDFISHWV